MNHHHSFSTTLVGIAGAAALILAAGCGADAAATPPGTMGAAPATIGVAAETSSAATGVTTITPTTSGPATAGATTDGASTTRAPESSAAPTTDIYGYLKSFDPQTGVATYDEVDAFFGADAVRACAEDGVTDTSNDRCTGYYYRNVNPRVRQVAVTPDAVIRTLRGAEPVAGTPSDLAASVRRSGGSQLFRVGISDNQAVAVTAIYLP